MYHFAKLSLIFNAVFSILELGRCQMTTNVQQRTAFLNDTATSRLVLPSTTLYFLESFSLSFRTCHSGRLLYQQNTNASNSVSFFFTETGALNLHLIYNNVTDTIILSQSHNLLNNEWYIIENSFINGVVTLLVKQGQRIVDQRLVSNSTFRTYMWTLNLSGGGGVVIGGSGFTGCIQEGINLPIRSSDHVATSVQWGQCPLDSLNYTGCGVVNPDPCWQYPCQNGGTCQRNDTDYTCTCPVYYSGRNCETDQGDRGCSLHPCHNNATCVSYAGTTRRFLCLCLLGYTGVYCDTDIDECQSSPCFNGGQCLDLVNAYTCDCSQTGYRGAFCHVNIDECTELSPCVAGVACIDTPGSFQCDCPAGVTGQTCHIVVNECDSSPCQNRGTCRDGENRYSCTCPLGFTDVNCETNIDDCRNVTCPAVNSVCIDQVVGYTCRCRSGFYDPDNPAGRVTQCLEVNECDSDPCQNGATCRDLVAQFECACAPGYTGSVCEFNINECASNPCLNNARCTDETAAFSCQCDAGFTGTVCETNIDECEPRPCHNESTCVDLIDMYQCVCQPGWTGLLCEFQINECQSGPCQNAGRCEDQQNGFLCLCPQGFTGLRCESNIDDCEFAPCQNGAVCVDGVNEYTCNCTQAYMGQNCTEDYNACSFQPCQNGGICSTIQPSRDYTCTCRPGFTSADCDVNIDDCAGNTCLEYQVCVDGVNNYTCQCPLGFSGARCEVDINECASNPCKNGATCHNLIGRYECLCVQQIVNLTEFTNDPRTVYTVGYEGSNCERNISECDYQPSICLNNGVCREQAGRHYACLCGPDNNFIYYAGSNCQTAVDNCALAETQIKQHNDDDLPVCHNGGTCVPTEPYRCSCAAGWEGHRCKRNIDECVSNPCQYNGTCIDQLNGYACTCIPGLTGPNCEENINECDSNPCQNSGQCIDEINGYVCNCTDTGFVGTHCETNIDDCKSDPCVNSATCVDGVKEYTCNCLPGFNGSQCEVDIAECASSPCLNSATCVERSTNPDFNITEAEGYDCSCVPGFTGTHCETDIDECASTPCVFGTCSDVINGYTCTCTAGYTGVQCETEIDECALYRPCVHAAKCEDRVNDYFCLCQPQYGGRNCSVELIGCRNHNCLNGATCEPYYIQEHGYNCRCPVGFTGTHCEHLTTVTFRHDQYLTYESPEVSSDLDLILNFRTTLANGVLVFSVANKNYMRLSLKGGNMLELVYVGEVNKNLQIQTENQVSLNDGEWHNVHLTVSSQGPHMNLTLDHPDCPAVHGVERCLEYNVFDNVTQLFTLGVTYLSYARDPIDPGQSTLLDGQPGFVGCMRDVIVNRDWIIPQQLINENMATVSLSCPREDPCADTPCGGRGACQDQWYRPSCNCYRPYRGEFCADSFTAGTFSLGGVGPSHATFTIPEEQKVQIQSRLEMSFFVRTTDTGPTASLLFYLGGDSSDPVANATFLAVVLRGDRLNADLNLDGTVQTVVGPDVPISDGEQHEIGVDLRQDVIILKVDSYVHEQAISRLYNLNPKHLYFGGLPSSSYSSSPVNNGRKRRQITGDGTVPEFHYPTGSYRGTLQDIRLNSNLLHLHALETSEDDPPAFPVAELTGVSTGEVTEDICMQEEPCANNATCSNVFYNDFACDCPDGFRGKDCRELDYCTYTVCPGGSTCVDLADGFECVTKATFDGNNSYVQYRPQIMNFTDFSTLNVEFRTRDLDGLLLHIQSHLPTSDGSSLNEFITLKTENGVLVVVLNLGTVKSLATISVSDGLWRQVTLTLNSSSVDITLETLVMENDIEDSTVNTFSIPTTPGDTNLYNYVSNTSQIYAAGLPPGYDVRYLWNNSGVVGSRFFKGCLGEMRIGPVLLPFFPNAEFINQTTRNEFRAITLEGVTIGCHGDPVCDSHACANGATCVDVWNEYTCTCLLGFDGQLCEYNIDECQGHTCQNGATCVDGVAEYSCRCVPGYTGEFCETNIDECTPDLCINGTCVDLVNGYFCNCTEDYVGRHCDISRYATCFYDPCQNNATCNNVTLNATIGDDVLSFECTCTPGYTGEVCDTEIDFCHNVTCLNGASCDSLKAQEDFRCVCVPGYTGKLCETNIDECAPLLCKNGGTCIDEVNGFNCTCTEGWVGVECTTDVNECRSDDPLDDPCDNGWCLNTPGDFFCNCSDSGYQGETCAEDVDECALGYCKNGAGCTNNNGSYTCNCTLGYQGDNCHVANCTIDQCLNGATCRIDTDIEGTEMWTCDCPQYFEGDTCELRGACVDVPCANGATCVQVPGVQDNYTCQCAPGWRGQNCTDDVDECTVSPPCLNGATCSNLNGSYECACAAGFTGADCETDINECVNNSCVHGECLDTPGSAFCNCTGTGYEGHLCQSNINECEATPCMSGATCTDLDPFYNCTCTPGYVGNICHSADPCNDTQYCANGGTCSSHVDDEAQNVTATCTCGEDWEGPHCLDRVEDNNDIALTLGLAIGIPVAIVCIVVVIVLIYIVLRVRENRATRGTYSPSRQEMSGSRVDMNNHMKIPPPERLI